MDILIQASQLILSLSILVVLHELGHFLPARWFNTRVEKFYLFFNPWFSLFKYKKGDTEYGIGWLPLGGYVKISGMVDESMDKEQLKKPPQPWEFRAKPAWQRLIIMIGGVTVNLILGIIIYAMMLFAYGERNLPLASMEDGVWVVDSVALDLGFQSGDKIVAVNGQDVKYFENVVPEMIYASQVTVERDGAERVINLPTNFVEQLVEKESRMLFHPRMPVFVAAIPDSSRAKEFGLEKKDHIVALNGEPVKYFDEFKTRLQGLSGQEATLTVIRPDSTQHELAVTVSEEGTIGFIPAILGYEDMEKLGVYDFERRRYGFFESFPAGINKAVDKLSFYVRQFSLIFSPETGAYKSLGGFGTLGKLFPSTWSWPAFWEITAFLSLILAFMNILPIPALDGGHVMFLLYEVVTGRKPGEKFLEYAQYAGMILLLMLFVFANLNDIIRAFS